MRFLLVDDHYIRTFFNVSVLFLVATLLPLLLSSINTCLASVSIINITYVFTYRVSFCTCSYNYDFTCIPV